MGSQSSPLQRIHKARNWRAELRDAMKAITFPDRNDP